MKTSRILYALRGLVLSLVVVLAGGLCAASLGAQLLPRQVAAPPEDIVSGLLRLPDPAGTATRSRVALLRLSFLPSAQGWSARVELPVGQDGPLTLVALSPEADRWRLELAENGDPARSYETLARAGRAQREGSHLPLLGPGFLAERYEVSAVKAGQVVVRLVAPSGRVRPEGFVLVSLTGGPVLESRLLSHQLLAGHRVGFQASLRDDRAGDGRSSGASTGIAVEGMELRARTPAGEQVVALFDDGQHEDGAAGDGVYGGALAAMPAGGVFAQVVAVGRDAQGRRFVRTTEHAFPLVERAAVFTGSVTTRVLDEHRLGLSLGAWVFGMARELQVSAEVWGTTAAGQLVPVCWLSGVVMPEQHGSEASFALALDARWLNRVAAAPPLELRRLRLQDPDTSIPFDTMERVRLASAQMPVVLGAPPVAISTSMTLGPPASMGAGVVSSFRTPVAFHGPVIGTLPLDRALMLSHGYCSGGGIWPAQDFTGHVIEFIDPGQNRSHDDFAQLLKQFGEQVDSFGLLAHSQGGAAGLHLYTYYFSGLDLAQGPRRIQAVATPWGGTPLASSLAGLGSIFGVGCGSNFDLSSDGAALWLAGIPSWARAEVYYWTTQAGSGACDFLTNLVLASPNDGVVEMAQGQLAGATNMGHVSGWCHVTGMSSPANYTDHPRNMERDAAAAR